MFTSDDGVVDASLLGFGLVAYVVGIIGVACVVIAVKIGANARKEARYLTASDIIAKAESAIYLLFLQSQLFREYGEEAYGYWKLNYFKCVMSLHDESAWAAYTARGQLPLATHPAYPAGVDALHEIENMLRAGGLIGRPIPATLAA